MNCNRKYLYNFLILLILLILSIGLTIFSLSKGTVVNAESDNNIITQNNSICLSFYLKSNQNYEGIEDLRYDSFIFKLSDELPSGYYSFNLNCRVNSDITTSNYVFGFQGYGNYGNFNTDETDYFSTKKSITQSFQYVQVLVPFAKTKINGELVEYSLTAENIYTSVTSELLYEIKSSNLENNVYHFNNNFNLKTFNSINDIITEPIQTYSISFKGLTENGFFDLISFDYDVDIVNNEILTETSFEEMYNQATNMCQSYTLNNKWYDFVGWDLNLEDISDFKTNLVIKPIYSERTSTTYVISFYGALNDLLERFNYVVYSNGSIDSSTTIENMYYLATEKANELINNAGFNEDNNSYDYYFNKIFNGWSIPYNENMVINSNLNIYGKFDVEDINYNVNIYNKDKELIETKVVNNGSYFGDLGLISEKIYLWDFKGFYTFEIVSENNFQNYHLINDYTMITSDLNVIANYEYIGVEIYFYGITEPILMEQGEYINFDYLEKNPTIYGQEFSHYKRMEHFKNTGLNLVENDLNAVIGTDVDRIYIQAVFKPITLTENKFEMFYINYLQPIIYIIFSIFGILILLLIFKKIIFRK